MALWAKEILISSDHAGFRLKEFLKEHLHTVFTGIKVTDLGPSDESRVDYPDFAKAVAQRIQQAHKSGQKDICGLLVCGSGQGMAIMANRFKGVRAALVWDELSARLSREHNDANILALGGRLIPENRAIEIAKVWLTTDFEGGRHLGRVQKMDEEAP